MTKRIAAAVTVAVGWFAAGASADPLAAPGDCAQPSRELVTQPVFGVPANVAGPASNHFAPRDGAASDVAGLLPSDLTRTHIDGTLTGVETAVEAIGDTATTATGTASETIDGATMLVNETTTDVVNETTSIVDDTASFAGDTSAGLVNQTSNVIDQTATTLDDTATGLLGGLR